MKNNRLLMVISVLSLIVIILGTTFSYFSISTSSNENAVGLTALNFETNVEIIPLYNDKSLIPMDDNDVMKGYSQQCIDDNNYGACQAYTITITNNGEKMEYDGIINFNVNDIDNLKYLLLDENNEVYVTNTEVVSGTDQTLGNSFELDNSESKSFVLVIWLSNLAEPQDDYDAGGSFSASVTYRSTSGSKITGSFSVN